MVYPYRVVLELDVILKRLIFIASVWHARKMFCHEGTIPWDFVKALLQDFASLATNVHEDESHRYRYIYAFVHGTRT